MRKKILLVFAVTWLIAVTVIAIVTVSNRITQTRISEDQKNAINLNVCRNKIQENIDSINTIGLKFALNSNVRKLLSDTYIERSDEEKRQILNKVSTLINDATYRARFGYTPSIALVCDDGRIYSNPGYSIKLVNNEETVSGLNNIPEETMTYSIEANSVFNYPGSDISAQYVRRIKLYPQSGYGTIVFAVPNYMLTESFSTVGVQEWAILDRNNIIIESNRAENTGLNAKEVYNYELTLQKYDSVNGYITGHNGEIVSYLYDNKNNLTYLLITPYSTITASTQSLIITILTVCTILILILLAFSWYLSRRFTAPLEKLERTMYEAEKGNLDIRMNPNSDDEIGRISNRFDKMMDRLQSTMADIQRVEKENRKAEMKIMELQLKPHFLYNTLSSIIWLANEDRKDEVMDITKALALFYRITLSDGRDEIPVRDEVGNVRNYAKIQNYRYKDKFRFYYNISEDIEDCIVPKLILQPLVENAINYGMKLKEGKDGYIMVKGFKQDGELIFEVRDNGDVATEESIADLNEAMENGTSGIGTGNVYGRIRHYGEKYRLKFDRIDGVTTARINLPVKMEELDD